MQNIILNNMLANEVHLQCAKFEELAQSQSLNVEMIKSLVLWLKEKAPKFQYDVNSLTLSKAELKKLYRKAALVTHPDKGGNEDVFKIVTFLDKLSELVTFETPKSAKYSPTIERYKLNHSANLSMAVLGTILPWSYAKKLNVSKIELCGLPIPEDAFKLFIIIAELTDAMHQNKVARFKKKYQPMVQDYLTSCQSALDTDTKKNLQAKYNHQPQDASAYEMLLHLMIRYQLKEQVKDQTQRTFYYKIYNSKFLMHCIPIIVFSLYMLAVWYLAAVLLGLSNLAWLIGGLSIGFVGIPFIASLIFGSERFQLAEKNIIKSISATLLMIFCFSITLALLMPVTVTLIVISSLFAVCTLKYLSIICKLFTAHRALGFQNIVQNEKDLEPVLKKIAPQYMGYTIFAQSGGESCSLNDDVLQMLGAQDTGDNHETRYNQMVDLVSHQGSSFHTKVVEKINEHVLDGP